MNQPVLKTATFDSEGFKIERPKVIPVNERRNQIVTKSKTELSPPKNTEKFFTKLRFQFFGFFNSSSSTLSFEIERSGASVRRLVRRICDAVRGRKGSRGDTRARVMTFPIFPDSVFKMYFVVLLKILLPSTIPSKTLTKLFLVRIMSAPS